MSIRINRHFSDLKLGPKREKEPNIVFQKKQKHEEKGGRYYPLKIYNGRELSQDRIVREQENLYTDEWGAMVHQINDYHKFDSAKQAVENLRINQMN
jgi:hypothetical protein